MTPVELLESRRLLAADPGGSLVGTFGQHGVLAGTALPTASLHPLADGKLLGMVGTTLERFLPSGQLDTTYGTAGTVPITAYAPTGPTDLIHDFQVAADGRALIRLSDYPSLNEQLRLVDADGTPDATAFDGQPDVLVNQAPSNFFRSSTITLDSQRITPAGDVLFAIGSFTALSPAEGTVGTFDLSKVLANGGADPTFGSAGAARFSAGDLPTTASAIAYVAADGDVYLSGPAALTRLEADGSVDTTFGTGGGVTFAAGTTVTVLADEADGGVLVSAETYDTATSRVTSDRVERLNAQGTVDADFGGVGQGGVEVTAAVGQAYYEDPVAVSAVADGGFAVVAATHPNASNPGTVGYTLKRYSPAGQVDADFGTDGTAGGTLYTAAAATSFDGSRLTLTPDGQLFAEVSYELSGSPTQDSQLSGAVAFEVDVGDPLPSPMYPTTPAPTPTPTPTPSPTPTPWAATSTVALVRRIGPLVAGRAMSVGVAVRVTNGGTTTINRPLTVRLRLTDDAGVTSSLSSAVRRLSLRAGRSAVIRLPLGTPAATLDGAYTLSAVVSDASGHEASAVAAGQLTVVQVAAMLTADVVRVASAASGGSIVAIVTLSNTGTAAASGPVTITTGLGDRPRVTTAARAIRVPAGRTVRRRVVVAVPTDLPAGSYALLVSATVGGVATPVAVTTVSVI